jgi:RimJ/RimL family protein N-acetyltransferase
LEFAGKHVSLKPADIADAAGLFAALDDERVWEFGFAGGPAARPDGVEGMSRLLARWTSPVGRQVYIIRPVGADKIIGTTSLLDISLQDERIHIGGTALSPATWGSAVNADSKRLLLSYVFDDCGFGRVKLQADAANARSQAAIAKLGAVREGVLRHHTRRADGTFRDTVVFSILREEWPAVRQVLDLRVNTRSNPR